MHITRGNDNEEEQLLNFNKLKHLQNLRMYVKYMESFTNMHFHQLTELHMVYCSDGDWNIFTKRNPNVKSLTINKMEVLSVDNIKVITSNWKLEELVLEFIHPTSYNPGLNHPEGVDMEILQVILENGNHLKKLKVGLKGDKKNFMGVLAKFEPKLKLMEAELVLCSKFP